MTSVGAQVDVPLPVDEAFRVFTDEIDAWYLKNDQTLHDYARSKAVHLEPHVGGRLLEVYDEPGGDFRVMATVTVWEPGRRLVFVDGDDTEVEVTFAEWPSGTRVTVEHRGLERVPPERRDHVRQFSWRILTHWFHNYTRTGASR